MSRVPPTAPADPHTPDAADAQDPPSTVTLSGPQRHLLETYLGIRAERVAAMFTLRYLAERCRAANAEFRCIDAIDRWVGAIVLGLLAVAGLYILGANWVLRSLTSAGMGSAGCGAACGTLWVGLFLACGAYLLGVIAWLRRRTLARPVPHPGWFGR